MRIPVEQADISRQAHAYTHARLTQTAQQTWQKNCTAKFVTLAALQLTTI